MTHESENPFSSALAKARAEVTPGDIYHHYTDKDKQYKILDIGIKEDTETACVVYKALYGDELVWIRDLDSWLSYVETPVGKLPRFKKL